MWLCIFIRLRQRVTCSNSFYIDGLVKKVSEFTNVLLIATAADNHRYNHLVNDKVHIFNGGVESVFFAIANAKAMVSTDSGFRYIAYGSSVPCITFSANCMGPGQVPLSHQIRWLMFTSHILPLNYSFVYVAKIVKGILDRPGMALVPFVQDFDRDTVNRIYTINKEKTKWRLKTIKWKFRSHSWLGILFRTGSFEASGKITISWWWVFAPIWFQFWDVAF